MPLTFFLQLLLQFYVAYGSNEHYKGRMDRVFWFKVTSNNASSPTFISVPLLNFFPLFLLNSNKLNFCPAYTYILLSLFSLFPPWDSHFSPSFQGYPIPAQKFIVTNNITFFNLLAIRTIFIPIVFLIYIQKWNEKKIIAIQSVHNHLASPNHVNIYIFLLSYFKSGFNDLCCQASKTLLNTSWI